MKDNEHDDRLTQALRDLPAVPASEGFTRGVLGRLDRAEPEILALPRILRYAVAGAALVGVGFVIGANYRAGKAAEEVSAARAQALRAETTQLLHELETLHELAQETIPVYYLGGDEKTDLLLDVGAWMQPPPGEVGLGVQPASYTSETKQNEPGH